MFSVKYQKSFFPALCRRLSTVVPQPPLVRNRAHNWMSELVEIKGRSESPELRDVLFVVQHRPVYTLGKAATPDNVLFSMGPDCPYDVHRIERGGEVTYHGPGQLTVYPILNQKQYKKDLHWYVSQLESVVIEVLKKYNIEAGIDPKNPGVWINDAKIAALGCKFSRWVTMHGFALNVNLESLNGFKNIVPCGIHDRKVVSLEDFYPNVTMEQVTEEILESFSKVFNVEIVQDDELVAKYDCDLALHERKDE